MFRKLVALATASVASLALILPVGTASAQTTGYATSFSTAITYQNVGTDTASITFSFYPEGSATAVPYNTTLPVNAGSSLLVGNVSGLQSGFTGSGVISSSQPVVATLVQLPASGSAVKNRPLTNGFDSSAGATKFLIPTVLKNMFGSTTQFSVQNVDGSPVSGSVKFFKLGSQTPLVTLPISNLPSGAAKFFDAGKITQLGSSFNGSVSIETTGKVVASALELGTTSIGASGFDGFATGANTVYMPSAQCNFSAAKTNTAYAVQNIDSSATAQVTVRYSNGATASANILPGNKASFQGCQATGMTQNFSGSATITSTGAQIVAIGKVTGNNGRLTTAFSGATAGGEKLALPYIRWSDSRYSTNQRDRQRAFIAIQNVGGALAANTVVVKYYDRTGTFVGQQALGALATGAKANSTAKDALGAAGAEFGYSAGGIGGSAVVEGPAGSQLVAVVRIQSAPASGIVAEDYNGIPVQ